MEKEQGVSVAGMVWWQLVNSKSFIGPLQPAGQLTAASHLSCVLYWIWFSNWGHRTAGW